MIRYSNTVSLQGILWRILELDEVNTTLYLCGTGVNRGTGGTGDGNIASCLNGCADRVGTILGKVDRQVLDNLTGSLSCDSICYLTVGDVCCLYGYVNIIKLRCYRPARIARNVSNFWGNKYLTVELACSSVLEGYYTSYAVLNDVSIVLLTCLRYLCGTAVGTTGIEYVAVNIPYGICTRLTSVETYYHLVGLTAVYEYIVLDSVYVLSGSLLAVVAEILTCSRNIHERGVLDIIALYSVRSRNILILSILGPQVLRTAAVLREVLVGCLLCPDRGLSHIQLLNITLAVKVDGGLTVGRLDDAVVNRKGLQISLLSISYNSLLQTGDSNILDRYGLYFEVIRYSNTVSLQGILWRALKLDEVHTALYISSTGINGSTITFDG